MRSRAVSIADLKTNLSTHLARVRSGEEIVIRDHRAPIAKIVPLAITEGVTDEEIALVAEGKVRLPKEEAPSLVLEDIRAPRSDRSRPRYSA